MQLDYDTKGQPYIQWEQVPGIRKRVWIQVRKGEKDWAGSGKYLNVVRIEDNGRVGGNPTDFPVWNKAVSDEELLYAFVFEITKLTGGFEKLSGGGT